MKDPSLRNARLIQAAFVVLLGLAWLAIGQTGAVSALFLPPMEGVWQAFLRLVQTTQFWSAVGTTLATVAEAYIIALALGVPLLVLRGHQPVT